jgi:cytochrome c553
MELTKKQRNMIEERIASYSVVTVSGAEEVETVVNGSYMAGELLYAACGACHGANGGGGVGPKLKGQTAEYIVGRLNQYKNGEKVGNQSNLMWGQAAGLSEKDINDLADYIVTL